MWSSEFGGRALSEGVWVGLRPSSLEGVSEGVSKCRGRALGGGVGAGLRLCVAGGRLRGQRIRSGSPTGFLVPQFTGKALALFCSFLPLSHHLPQGLPPHHWTPNCGWVPVGVGTPSLPQPPLRGAGPRGPAFTFAPPSLPLTPSGPTPLEGASVGRGSGLGSQQVPGSPSGQGNLATLPFDALPSQWFPSFPLWVWDPFVSPSRPSGAQSHPASTSPPPSLPPHPTSYPVTGGSSRPLRCPWSPTSSWWVP